MGVTARHSASIQLAARLIIDAGRTIEQPPLKKDQATAGMPTSVRLRSRATAVMNSPFDGGDLPIRLGDPFSRMKPAEDPLTCKRSKIEWAAGV